MNLYELTQNSCPLALKNSRVQRQKNKPTVLLATCSMYLIFNICWLHASAFHSICTVFINSVAYSSAFVNVVDCGNYPCLLWIHSNFWARSKNNLQLFILPLLSILSFKHWVHISNKKVHTFLMVKKKSECYKTARCNTSYLFTWFANWYSWHTNGNINAIICCHML